MKIHGSISRHPKIKVKELVEAKNNSALKDGTADVFSKSEGAGFEANLMAAINKSDARKSRENALQSDDQAVTPIIQNNILINDLAQKKQASEGGISSDQSNENSTGSEISDQTAGMTDKISNQTTDNIIDPDFKEKNNSSESIQIAGDIPLSETNSEIFENAIESSNLRPAAGIVSSKIASKVSTDISNISKMSGDAEGNSGLSDDLNNKDIKSPFELIAKEYETVQIKPKVTTHTGNVEPNPIEATKVTGLVDSLNPQDNKSGQIEASKLELGIANINSNEPEAAGSTTSNPNNAVEITAMERLVEKDEKGDFSGSNAPKTESKPMEPVADNTESLTAPVINKSESTDNSTDKTGQIKPVLEDKFSRSAENSDGTKQPGRQSSDPVTAENGESPIREIEKIGLGRPAQNIKRVGRASEKNDENNRPTNAANIHTASDKSAEKTSQKFSSEENLNGEKNKSGEKKLNSTPIEVLANKPNNAPIKLKSQHEMNLPQERPVSLSQMNEELPRVLTSQANNAKSTMSFKLTPGSLGTLFVEVEISKGEVKAKFTAETKEAQAAIEANMPALKEKLEEAGLKLTHSECGLERREDGSASSDRQKRQSSQKPQYGSDFSLEPDKEEKTTPRLRTKSGSIIEEFV